MRKLVIPAMVALVALAVAGIAWAANVYTVEGHSAPAGKGTKAKPIPKALDFDFTVADEVAANRGIPLKSYFIAAEGLVTYPEAFPNCSGGSSGANAPDLAAAQRACRRARVGGGVIKALVGSRNTPTESANCVLNLNLYNLKPGNYGEFGRVGKNGGLAIRIDGDPPPPPNLDNSQKGMCLAAQHQSILATYHPVKIQGQPSDELRFTVPPELLHPAQGLDVTVRQVFSEIAKKTAKKKIKGKKRTVGFYSAVGCKGRQRSVQVTFVTETGQRTPVSDQERC
jgi:hypothetical protein